MTDNEVLFQYLRSILFDAKANAPARDSLGEESLALYDGLDFLARSVAEYCAFANAISGGDLSIQLGNKKNTLCYPLKNLQANLRHLTWQAKRVAAGDYTQEVSFLGEFSDAFNTMTRQLREREEQLRHTIEGVERQKEALYRSNELLVALTDNINELIVVNDAHTGDVLYLNKPEALQATEGLYLALLNRIKLLLKSEPPRGKQAYEVKIDHAYYRIVSFAIEWNARDTYASVVQDVTADRLKAQELEDNSNRDPATGLYNRRYCMARLTQYIAEQVPFSLCFIDLDNLKYVNDNFGHIEGDRYIAGVATEITSQIRRADLCARMGGDEFVVLFLRCPGAVAEQKMQQVSRRIADSFGGAGMRRQGISYGIVEADYAGHITPDDLLEKADRIMYEKKRSNKMMGDA